MKRIFLIMVVLLLIVIIGGLSYLKIALPNVGEAEEIKIELTPKKIEHGKYLANAVAVCMDCHSTRDWSLFSGPLVSGTLGKGGEVFSQEFGFPGRYTSKNITPYGIGNWTDGEVLRAFSSGVNKNGKALFPIMPHPSYGKLDKEDLLDIIAYLRTLPSIKNDVEESVSDFPMSLIINTIPTKAEYSRKPDENNLLEYGKYLFTMASCADCHTKQDKGKPIEGMEMAGGFEFPLDGMVIRSANITSDKETGIGTWDEQTFVNRFKTYSDSGYVDRKINPGEFQTVMPWKMYAQMKDSDLRALYAYLKTIKAVNNKVEKFSVVN